MKRQSSTFQRWALMGLLLPILFAGCLGGSGGGGSFAGAGVLRGFVTEFETQGQVFQGGVEGVTVSVQDTELVATTANDGFFIISGVPPNENTLTFTFLGTSANLNVTVPENTEVDLKQVRIRGGEAKADDVEVTQLPPPAQAQQATGSGGSNAPAPGSGDTAPAGTPTSSGSGETGAGSAGSSMGSGMQEPQEPQEPQGPQEPQEPQEPEEPEEQPEELEAEGPVQSVTSNSIRVDGKTFQVTGSTVILDEDENRIPLSALQPGQDVEMKGRRVGGQSLATLIKRRD